MKGHAGAGARLVIVGSGEKARINRDVEVEHLIVFEGHFSGSLWCHCLWKPGERSLKMWNVLNGWNVLSKQALRGDFLSCLRRVCGM